MDDNITRADANEVVDFLQQDPIPKLTNGPKVKKFEEEWSKWLGVKHSLMVSSGSAANELTMLALKYIEDRKDEGKKCEIIKYNIKNKLEKESQGLLDEVTKDNKI